MLQFITHPSEKYSIIDEVKMALEGGCRWIQLYMKDSPDEEVKKVVEEIIPLCQDAEAILVIDNRVNLTLETKVHGVFLGKAMMPALEARETLGAGAIIGGFTGGPAGACLGAITGFIKGYGEGPK